MLWLFEREGDYFRFEAGPAKDGQGYELTLTHPDGTQIVERFEDSSQLSQRQQAIEAQLAGEGWNGPHGWFA
jgi:hypothetical protein